MVQFIYNPFINNLDAIGSGGGGSGITTLSADSGSATGSTVKITGGSTGLTTSGSGSTITFTGVLNGAHGGTGVANTGLTINLGSATTGYVLTSDSSGNATWQAASGGGVTTIQGDTGSITGSTVTIYANNAVQNCGSTVLFDNTASTSTLKVTDANFNVIIGLDAGNGSISGTTNVGLGVEALQGLTSGSNNVALGQAALGKLTTGSNNTCVGYDCANNLGDGNNNIIIGNQAGNGFGSNESSNIVIGSAATTGLSNTIIIGAQGSGDGQQNTTYIAGIAASTLNNADVPQVVLCEASTGRLGVISSGTSGFVLTSNGSSAPSFQAAGGGGGSLTLIQTQTATSATSLAFTTGITTANNNYLLIGTNLTDPTFAGSNFGLQISTNGGSSYINTGYYSGFIPSTVLALSGLDTTETVNFEMTLTNFTSGTGYVASSGTTAFYDSSVPGGSSGQIGGLYVTSSTVVNAFQLVADDGSAFSGTFSLYKYSM
jgi:hypothetical protein